MQMFKATNAFLVHYTHQGLTVTVCGVCVYTGTFARTLSASAPETVSGMSLACGRDPHLSACNQQVDAYFTSSLTFWNCLPIS